VLKVMAILRTLFLLFLVGISVRAMPVFWKVAQTRDEDYARLATSLDFLKGAVWYAIAWILFDTIVGWLIAVHRSRAERAAKAAPAPKA
jgi:hypothetical protein